MLEIIQGEQQPYKIDLTSKKTGKPFDLTGNVEIDVCFKAGSTVIVKKKTLSQVVVDSALLGQISGNLEVGDTESMSPLTDGQIEVLVNFTGLAVAQISNIAIGGTTDGTYEIVINGVTFSFIAAANTAVEIRDGLIAAIGGGSQPVTPAIGGGTSLDVTANNAGQAFLIALGANPGANMVLTTPTPNVSPNVKKAQFLNAFSVIAKICP